jgi:HPt (histidine-containing phosphotransfer) domain-containing protein
MREDYGQDLALLDASVLDRLRAKPHGGQGVWKVLVEDFVEQLPARIETLRQALTSGDAKGAREAVLNLRTSCQTIGVPRLSSLTLLLEHAMRVVAGADPGIVLPHLAAVHLGEIKRCAQQTAQLLTAHLKKPPTPTRGRSLHQ